MDDLEYARTHCPVGRALEVVGNRSTMLILREAFYGTRRFDGFAARVGVTDPVAAARLRELTAVGILERRPYQEPGQRTRYEYRLTQMGRDLAPAILGLFEWGDRYLFDEDEPRVGLAHAECGEPLHVVMRCEAGHDVPLREARVVAQGTTSTTISHTQAGLAAPSSSTTTDPTT